MSRRLLLASGSGGPVIEPPDPEPQPNPFPWEGPVNVVVDGNSIYADYYTVHGPFSNHIFLEEPFASSGFTHNDAAITTQTWRDMTDVATDVDAKYAPGKTNVLVASETTNSIYTFATSPAETVADATAYIARVRSVHPDWIILLAGSLPAEGSHSPSEDLVLNLDMIEVDDHMAANFAAMGADGYVSYRDLPPFVGTGTTTPYDAFPGLWHDHIHPADPGKVYMRQRVVQALLELPAEH